MEHKISYKIVFDGLKYSFEDDQDVGNENNVDEPIPDGSTDLAVGWGNVDVSEMKGVFMVSDQDLTLKTNSSSTPDDTINLVAGKPYFWSAGLSMPNPLSTDVTGGLFVTNSSGQEANLIIRMGQDPTP